MSINETFRELKKRDEGCLIAYVTGGDPLPKYTPKIAEALVKGGADIIEIGIPFSDPIADGPTIQAAYNRALSVGTTPNTIFNIVKKTKKRIDVPIILLTYYNIIFKMGVNNFLEKAREYDIDGLIIPDLPIEEAADYKDCAEKTGINTIFLATPSTSMTRLKHILDYASGFLYLVSVFGVTGVRDDLVKITTDTIKKFKSRVIEYLPIAVGFGLSKPEHLRTVIDCGAEGAIVGSAFVKIIESNLDNSIRMMGQISLFAKELKNATIKRA